MDVTVDNFETALLQLKMDLREADLVAIDAEMTGLQTHSSRNLCALDSVSG